MTTVCRYAANSQAIRYFTDRADDKCLCLGSAHATRTVREIIKHTIQLNDDLKTSLDGLHGDFVRVKFRVKSQNLPNRL